MGLGIARVVRAGVLGLEVIHVLPPGAAAATHPYTLYATIVFTLVVTYGLVMMANEQAGRREAAAVHRAVTPRARCRRTA